MKHAWMESGPTGICFQNIGSIIFLAQTFISEEFISQMFAEGGMIRKPFFLPSRRRRLRSGSRNFLLTLQFPGRKHAQTKWIVSILIKDTGKGLGLPNILIMEQILKSLLSDGENTGFQPFSLSASGTLVFLERKSPHMFCKWERKRVK